MLNLYLTSELLTMFMYMEYSNFDNPVFEFFRAKVVDVINIVQTTIPKNFVNIGYSSSSILINFIDKLIIMILFAYTVIIIWLFCKLFQNKSTKFVKFLIKKDSEFRYEGLSRFIVELVLNLSISIWINIIYGNFSDSFNSISYLVTILMLIIVLFMVIYCFVYPIYYYEELCTSPEKHERHKLLYSEFKRDKLQNLFFYSYFIIYRFLFAFIIVYMYAIPEKQCICITIINLVMLRYTYRVFKSCIVNFLHFYNSFIQTLFSLCLILFLNANNPNKLKICGYMCIGILTIFFITNLGIVIPQLIIQVCTKLKEKICKKTKEGSHKSKEIKEVVVPQSAHLSSRDQSISSANSRRILDQARYDAKDNKNAAIEKIKKWNSSKIFESRRKEIERKFVESSIMRHRKFEKG